MEISGARSIEEQFEGEPNAQEVAEAWKLEGFKGCWVLALGTNEAANVFVGSAVGEMERIEIMMNTIGDEPVMWVNVRSLVEAGDPYSARTWRSGTKNCSSPASGTPTCASTTGPPTSKTTGSSKTASTSPRPATPPAAELIAQALAHAFPAKGESEGGRNCLVS